MTGDAGSIPAEVAVFLKKAKNENASLSIEMSAPLKDLQVVKIIPEPYTIARDIPFQDLRKECVELRYQNILVKKNDRSCENFGTAGARTQAVRARNHDSAKAREAVTALEASQ